MRVLGVDPGTLRTGWGVIEKTRRTLTFCAGDVVSVQGFRSLPERLRLIHAELLAVIDRWTPHVLSLEKAFVAHNVQSALRLGEARGVVLLAAAQAVGGASYAMEITVEYAKARQQFNKALAEFQAISHYLADARTTLDGARLLVYEAAWAHSTRRSTEQLAPMAKLFACQTYRDITAMCQQVFGGIGFTVEYDIQLYFRRAKQLQLSWWDQATCEDRIADAVLGPC